MGTPTSPSARLEKSNWEKYQARHSTGKIHTANPPYSPSTLTNIQRPKSVQQATADIIRLKRHTIHIHRLDKDDQKECVLLDPPGDVSMEAHMFPLEDDPNDYPITIRSCLTGIIMGLIGSAVGLVSHRPYNPKPTRPCHISYLAFIYQLFIFKPVVVYLAPVFLQVRLLFSQSISVHWKAIN